MSDKIPKSTPFAVGVLLQSADLDSQNKLSELDFMQRPLFCWLLNLGALSAWLAANTARATWYKENVEDGADIIEMDLRWPWWSSDTYFANWNSSFNPKPNNLSFYAGFLSSVPDGPGSTPNPDAQRQSSFRPGSVWTFWGSGQDGTPVRFTDVAPNLYIKNDYGGEGSSGTVGSEVWPFVEAQHWYTMLARVWRPADDSDPGGAYVGRWIKDLTNHRWHFIGMARLPIPATSFTGNSGFLEPLTSEKAVRSLHRRLGYFRKDGTWRKSDTITIDKTEFVVVNTIMEGDHEYAAIEYAQRPDLLPRQLTGKPISGDRAHSFQTRQPDSPTLDAPMVDSVRCETTGQQIRVEWSIPETSSPMLGYKLEVFDSPRCVGLPKAIKQTRDPAARQALLDTPVMSPTVRLTVFDVFDQATKPVSVRAIHARRARTPPATGPTQAGLHFTLFQNESLHRTNYFNPPLQAPDEEHHWLYLRELSLGHQIREGHARGFDPGIREELESGYAVLFRGFLRIPQDGFYALHAHIDGAYRLRIDDREVILRDGQLGTTATTAVERFARGDHPLEVTHVYDRLAAHNFSLEWEGPNLPRQPIPLEALRISRDPGTPSPVIQASAPGNGTGAITVSSDSHGHRVERTTLRLGSLELASTNGAALAYQGPLPAGTNLLNSRISYDGNHSADSDPVRLVVTGPAVDPAWTARNVGDGKSSAGLWQTGPGSFQFFGEGMHTVTRRITGDFTATCRLDAYSGSGGEPVNRQAWTGLTAREHGERQNWEWGRDFHLVQTAFDGLRASADFTDFGATRVTSYPLAAHQPWLRIARKGSVWTAWTSTNGRTWELGAYQYKKMEPVLDVGLFFSALPQERRAHYQSRVSELRIEEGTFPESTPPTPVAAGNTGGDRITGVTVARSDARRVVVRSTSRGLLRTKDGGRSWERSNGGLGPDAMAVRSVAIHPTDPNTLLLATGGSGTGSLWKSADGGDTWRRLDLDCDFDGTGPSALCGEVVAFDLKHPEILYVGCESKGFFKSTDAGTNWIRLGLVGERITAVTVWPWESHYPAPAQGKSHLCVTTCPDHWMELLGRGRPHTMTSNTVSRGYVSNDGIQTLVVADEREDTGFYNVAFDKALQSTGEMRYGTAHGYQSQVFAGSHMALYPPAKNLEWMRPMTAVGATAVGDRKFGRFIAQALDPLEPKRLSFSELWAFEWSWLIPQGDPAQGGLIAVAGDPLLGESWWFVHTDGLYHSPDGGKSRVQLLDRSGEPLALGLQGKP